MQRVAAVNLDGRGLAAAPIRVSRRPADRLSPVRSNAFGMLWMITVRKRMANQVIPRHPDVPRAPTVEVLGGRLQRRKVSD
jgi:hypothetical protein